MKKKYMIATQKVNKMVIYGHDASCPQKILGNKMVRAQFIVPLQHNYSQKAILYCKIICNIAHIIFHNITKCYIQPAKNIFEIFGL